MKVPIHLKKKFEKYTRSIFSNTSWERIKNSVRPALLQCGLMPDIVRDDYSYYLKTTKSFVDYLEKNKDKLDILKSGLDDESQNEIDHFVNKVHYISTHEILERNKIFTKKEILEQIESLATINKKEKLYKKFEGFEYYPSETFYGLNGIKWLPDNVTDEIKHGTVLDVGACFGDSAIAFYYNLDSKNIISFEPESHNFERLSKNLAMMNEPGIVPVELGISNQNGTLKISNDTYMSTIADVGESINVVTIDDYIKKNNINKVSLIKMDIEGEEMKALLGAQDIIKRDMPVLSIAIYHNPQDFFEIKPWIEHNFKGYTLKIKKSNPFDPLVEVTLLAYPKNV